MKGKKKGPPVNRSQNAPENQNQANLETSNQQPALENQETVQAANENANIPQQENAIGGNEVKVENDDIQMNN